MIKDLEIVIPENKILNNFNDAIKPIFEKIKINSLEIQSLSKTRDELLPKLMSGKVRVV
jgi:type I restriction enzyme S subunit